MPSALATSRNTYTLMLCNNSLYGGFLVLYIISVILLRGRRKTLMKNAIGAVGFQSGDEDRDRLKTMRFWEITGTIIFLVLTIHYLLLWIVYVGEPPEMASRKIVFYKLLLEKVVILTGDLVIIHRLWVIVNKKKVYLILPFISMMSFLAFSAGLLYQYYLVYWRLPLSPIMRQGLWMFGVVSSTLSVNVYCTVIVAGKIWWANRGAKRYGGGQLMHIFTILVESAAIYSLWMSTVLALLIIKNSLYINLYDIATQVYGFSTMLISVRVGLGWAIGSSGLQSEKVSTWRVGTSGGFGNERINFASSDGSVQ